MKYIGYGLCFVGGLILGWVINPDYLWWVRMLLFVVIPALYLIAGAIIQR